MNKRIHRSLLPVLYLVPSSILMAQVGSLEGMILTDRDAPLPFANVVVQGTRHGTTTDASGRFNVEDLPYGEYEIVVSSVGFAVIRATVRIPRSEGLLELRTNERVVDLPAFTVMTSLTGGTEQARNADGSAWYLGPRELEQNGYTDIHRVLRAIPGVNIQEEDGLGLRPNIGLRGAAAQRSAKITVMEDGILAAPAPYASPAAYYFPTMGRMNGIEVVKGSSQIRHGPLTTGGALNLISTPVPEQLSGMVSMQQGSYGSRTIHAHAGTEHKGFGVLLETFQQATDGFKDLDNGGNTGTTKSDQLAKIQWRSKGDARYQHVIALKAGITLETGNETYLGLSDGDFSSTPFRRYAGSQQDRITVEHDLITARYGLTLPSGPRLAITAYRTNTYRNWYKLDKVTDADGSAFGIGTVLDDPERYATAYNSLSGTNSMDNALRVKANNRNYGTSGLQFSGTHEIQGERSTHRMELGIRVHGDYMDRFQHTDGYRMEGGQMLMTDPGAPGTESNRMARADAIAAHVLYNLQFGRFGMEPGMRYEHIAMVDENYGTSDPGRNGTDLIRTENTVDVWIPGFGVDVDITEALNAFVGVHKGFSPPGTDPGTKPESSVNYEAGVRIERSATFLQLIGFLNDYDELLGSDMAAAGGSGTGDLFNAGGSLVQGIEFHVSHDLPVGPRRGLRIPMSLNYTFTDARFENTFSSSFEGWGEVVQGDRIPYIPVHQLNARVGIECRMISVTLTATHVGDVPASSTSANDEAPLTIPSFIVFDLAATYRWSQHVEVFASVQNMLDRTYLASLVPAGARPGAPRMLFAGLRIRL